MPLAPAATLLARFPQQLAAVLAAHGTPDAVIDEEQRQMRDHRLAKTANRSVVGIMNEFTFLAQSYRGDIAVPDLLALAIRLATTPCSPLYSKHVSPDREPVADLRGAANLRGRGGPVAVGRGRLGGPDEGVPELVRVPDPFPGRDRLVP